MISDYELRIQTHPNSHVVNVVNVVPYIKSCCTQTEKKMRFLFFVVAVGWQLCEWRRCTDACGEMELTVLMFDLLLISRQCDVVSFTGGN